MHSARVRVWGPMVALVGFGLLGAAPALAYTQPAGPTSGAATTTTTTCLGAGGTLGVDAGQTVVLRDTSGTGAGPYVGDQTVTVFCAQPDGVTLPAADFGAPISDAQIQVGISPTAAAQAAGTTFFVNGTAAGPFGGTPGPVTLPVFNTTTTFTISSPTSDLYLVVQPKTTGIADYFDFTTASGTGTFGPMFAVTPELDSLALFGTGAVGLLGYATMRARARRRS